MQDREQTPPTKGGDYRKDASPYAANAESDLQWTGLSSLIGSALPGSSIQRSPVRPIGTEGVLQLNGCPGMGRPIDTGPVHRRQWRTGLVPLDILCRCQTMTWRALGKKERPEPSVRLGVLGFSGRNTNDPPGLPGGSLLDPMTDRHLVHIVPGRLFWGHDGDHTPRCKARAILRWSLLEK